jgi:hypothetical protein
MGMKKNTGKKFLNYINEIWEIDEVLDSSHFADLYNIDARLSRYYLEKYTEMGLLCRIKDDYNVYYIKTCWYNLFETLREYKEISVR